MGIKLHRSRQKVFQKKNTWLRAVAWIVGCSVIVAAGFFGAKLLDNPPPAKTPAVTTPTTGSTADLPTDVPPQATPPQPEQPIPDQPQEITTLRAFYLPVSALRDAAGLQTTLTQAAEAGFTGVVFDLKDSTGQLHYRFSCQTAQAVNSFTADALTPEQLQQAFSAITSAGLRPIPRLFAFRDHLGAKALSAARITPTGNPGWTWYDGDPRGNGKAWLNPYADEAHSYIIQLAQELQQAGADTILLDGVQFPFQTSSASFGNSANSNLSRSEVLTLFIDKVKTSVDGCHIILSCTTESALGTDTKVYGGNPLTFAPTAAAPTLYPSALPKNLQVGDTKVENTPDTLTQTVQALVAQMILRTKVMAEDSRPAIMPWLQAYDYSPAQIRQEIEGCAAAGCEEFILYNPNGSYDFGTLTLP